MNVEEIIVSDLSLMPLAQECSLILHIPVVETVQASCYLEINSKGVRLHNTDLHLSYQHSFLNANMQQRGQTKNQHILRAFKSKKQPIQSILDATAGWCRDSFILASNGFTVTALEQSPLVYSLNKIALALHNHPLEINLYFGNAMHFLTATNAVFDAIYLDPMFPQQRHRAKNKKELQILQNITKNNDINTLFEYSLQKAKQRTVVKRPIHAGYLGDLKPNFQYLGKTIRFDVYQQFNFV